MSDHPWLDDLLPGHALRGRGRTITEADVVGFAQLTGDHHPQHVDADWASRSAFGERIAHGMLIASYAVGMLDLPHERVVALRRVRDVVFKRPVRLGDTIRASATVEDVKVVDEAVGLVGVRVKVTDCRERLVARIVVEVLWRRDPAVADDAMAALRETAVGEPVFVPIPL